MKKEFVCRACGKFLDSQDLVDGCCPVCESDESIFLNE
jgi:rubrerythrin